MSKATHTLNHTGPGYQPEHYKKVKGAIKKIEKSYKQKFLESTNNPFYTKEEFADFMVEIHKPFIEMLRAKYQSHCGTIKIGREAFYELWENYTKDPEEVINEIGMSQPIGQRLIGAHTRDYDYNFFICRLFNIADLNIKVTFDVYDERTIWRGFCIDQQHGVTFEKEIIVDNELIDIEEFKSELLVVVKENGIDTKNSPEYKEIEKWIERGEKSTDGMSWKQVKNSQDLNELKTNMSLPFTVELTYSTLQAGANKTQKINDNAFSWVSWTKFRNLIATQNVFKALYKAPHWEMLSELQNGCEFFDKKRSSFASASQPGETDEGQIEEYLYKYIMSFIDDDGNIEYKNRIPLGRFSQLKDGSLGDKRYSIPQIDLFGKVQKQFSLDETAYTEQLHSLRQSFFDILNAIAPHTTKNGSVIKLINKHIADVADEWRNVSPDTRKNPLNIKDQRLSKTENTLIIMKSIACLYKTHSKSKGLTYDDIVKDYFNQYRKVLIDNLENDCDSVMSKGAKSESRHPFLTDYNDKVVEHLKAVYRAYKKDTSPTLRKMHDELFAEAVKLAFPTKACTIDGYYYNCKENKVMTKSNTDTGHDILKKMGREANMETTFIQSLRENRGLKGTFPKPVEYYQDQLNAINNRISYCLANDTIDETFTNITESRLILGKVIELYKKGYHKKLENK